MTSAALVLDEDWRPTELTVVSELSPEAGAASSLWTTLVLMLLALVQVAWLAALGYAALAFA